MKNNQSTISRAYEQNKAFGQCATKNNNQFPINRKHLSVSKAISTRHSYFRNRINSELPIPSYQVINVFGLKEKEFTEILNRGMVKGHSIRGSRKFYYASEIQNAISTINFK